MLHKASISEILATFHELDVDSSRSVVLRRDVDLLLEDDTVLGRHILVAVFHGLASDRFGEIEDFLVGVHIDGERTLIGVVRHVALDDEHVASLVGG